MPTFNITGDDPQRVLRVGLRQLTRGKPFDTIIVDPAGVITVVADEAPVINAPFLTVERLDDSVTAVTVAQDIIDTQAAAVEAEPVDVAPVDGTPLGVAAEADG